MLGVMLAGGVSVWATTIGTNLSVDGTLTVSSTSATSTIATGGLTVGTTQFAVQSVSGNVGIGTTVPATLLDVNSLFNVTSGGNVGVGVTNPASLFAVLGTASTTKLVISGTSASSTISTGGLTVGTTQFLVEQNSGNVGIGRVNPNTKFEVVGTASTTALIVGGRGTTLNGINAGVCTFPNTTIAATTTSAVSCASASGLVTTDNIFIMATSSLPVNFVVQSASSTAATTIGLQIINLGSVNGPPAFNGTATGVNSVFYWAFR